MLAFLNRLIQAIRVYAHILLSWRSIITFGFSALGNFLYYKISWMTLQLFLAKVIVDILMLAGHGVSHVHVVRLGETGQDLLLCGIVLQLVKYPRSVPEEIHVLTWLAGGMNGGQEDGANLVGNKVCEIMRQGEKRLNVKDLVVDLAANALKKEKNHVKTKNAPKIVRGIH